MTHPLCRKSRAKACAWALLGLIGCATEQYVAPEDNPDDTPAIGGLHGLGGSSAAGHATTPMSGAGKATGGVSGGRGGTTSKAGKSSGGSAPGDDGGAGSDEEGGSGPETGGKGGQAGGGNQPSQCDEATAVVLGTMSQNTMVPSNACLKMLVPVDQTWIKKITMQPDSGLYPLPYTWSNCGTNSSGAFTANYANQILNPVTAQCPVLVKLGGSGSLMNVQWWGG